MKCNNPCISLSDEESNGDDTDEEEKLIEDDLAISFTINRFHQQNSRSSTQKIFATFLEQ